MDADPSALLKQAALPYPGLRSYDGTHEKHLADLGVYLDALDAAESRGFWGGNNYLRGFYEKASIIVNPHILQRVVTDRQGKAGFAPVPFGTYFIVGAAAPPRTNLWNLQIVANQASVQVTLDEKNGL
jgi:hypothetical protein